LLFSFSLTLGLIRYISFIILDEHFYLVEKREVEVSLVLVQNQTLNLVEKKETVVYETNGECRMRGKKIEQTTEMFSQHSRSDAMQYFYEFCVFLIYLSFFFLIQKRAILNSESEYPMKKHFKYVSSMVKVS
jgi:hypothetical protein